MSDSLFRILIVIISIVFAFLALTLTIPISDGGKLARKLCLIDAAGWVFIMALPTSGHPPAYLIPLALFWLANFVMMPAAVFALWKSYKERQENKTYLAVAFTYAAINLFVFIGIPIIGVIKE
jgi:hypothetical protein